MNLNTEDKEVSLDYLKDTKIFNQLKKSFDQLEKGQTILCALSSGTEDKSLTLIKVGTLLSFSIVKKMLTNGYNPKDFTDDDWKEIANKVADLGILSDGRSYTRFVFKLYADYIKLSVNVNKDVFTEEKKAEILNLSDQLLELNTQFDEEKITEPDYVDKCLWISFEAIIKLLSAYHTCFMDSEFREFFQAVSDFAVQSARLSLYSKEQALLNEYIEHQYVLDDKLKEKYNSYILELEKRTNHFNNLINNAFDPEFKDMLVSSVYLAREAGVKEDQILNSMDKIDSYFS